MDATSGISGEGRSELARVVGRGRRLVDVDDVVKALGVDRHGAIVRLSRWAQQGWLRRVRRGLYIPVPVGAEDPASWTEDPVVLADAVWTPCCISGWTAANHWDLTEQVFQTTVVLTATRVRSSEQQLLDHRYLVSHVSEDALSWGLTRVWRDDRPVQFADAARTVVDVLGTPALGGGIRHIAEIVDAYLDEHSADDLIAHGDRAGNRAVFKRLGYILETSGVGDESLMDACRARVSQGTSRLDPGLPPSGGWSRRWGLRLNVQLDARAHS